MDVKTTNKAKKSFSRLRLENIRNLSGLRTCLYFLIKIKTWIIKEAKTCF